MIPEREAALSSEARGRLARYVEELQHWGERINLVGSTAPDALELHVADALAAMSALPAGARVADLGTGAGFPGIPLAIARPDVSFVLVEIRERRVHFLKHVVRSLGLRCEIWRQRIEQGTPEPFDLVVARAVGPAAEVLRACVSWLKPEGEAWIWTRADALECGVREATLLPIDPNGSRGHVLRVPVHAIPRGTAG